MLYGNTKTNAKLAVLAWARQELQQHGYTITANEEIVQDNPWSTVVKFTTNKGYVYLKQTPVDLFIEAKTTSILFTLFPKNIPEIIAANDSLCCFIMRSCGDASLRTIFNGKLQSGVLIQAVQIYKDIQHKSIVHVEQLLNVGVPDWRLHKYPALYKKLIDEAELLLSQDVTPALIAQLNTLYPKFCAMCLELADYNIPETLSHSDYHDNNMLLEQRTGVFSLIDLGEIAIEHPLFSIAVCLKDIEYRYNLTTASADYNNIQTVIWGGWVTNLAGSDSLRRIVYLVNTLLPIHLIFAEIRFLKAINPDDLKTITRRQNKLKNAIEEFIKNSEGY